MIARIASAILAASTLLILALTFVWPALAPQGAADAAYQVLAIGALWAFLVSMTVVLWVKACKAPRT